MDDISRLRQLEHQIRAALSQLVFRVTILVLIDLHKKRNLN